MIEAVIFDFDGVIGDTMKDNCIAWQHAFARYNFDLDAAEYYKLEGMGRFQIAEHIIAEHGLDINNVKEIVEAKELYYKQNNTFKIYDGVAEIFDYLKQHNILIAIVTGASRARISEHLDESLKIQLSALITADDVINTKPHPEPYLKAVAQLNKVPGNCLVIENAILGIQSARAAGCVCFALETTLSKADLMSADEVFSTHQELLIKLKDIF
jgi:beta-phosphoglucomutase